MKPIDETSEKPNEHPQKQPAPPGRPSGRFPKGASGNPKGRPRGSRNKATLLMESILQEHAEPLTRKLIETALAGDSLAMRICADRLLAPQKDRPIDLPLGPVETLPQVRSAISTVVQAISDGSITPTAGETVANILHLQSEVVNSGELARRVDELEEQVAALQNQQGDAKAKEITQILRADGSSGKDKEDAA